MVSLSWVNYTAEFDENTPYIVIQEILYSDGFKVSENEIKNNYENLLQYINTSEQITISFPPQTDEEWMHLGRFVNADEIWTREKLLFIYDRIRKLSSMINRKIGLPQIFQEYSPYESDFIVDRPTPQKFSLPLPLFYHLMRREKIPCGRTTLLENMKFLWQQQNLPVSQLNILCIETIKTLPRDDLLRILSISTRPLSISRTDKPYQYDREKLHIINPRAMMISTFNPISHEEAIFFVAREFKIDLTYADFPLEIARKISIRIANLNLTETRTYEQIITREILHSDNGMLKLGIYNPFLLDLRITFNPKLPPTCYSELNRLAIQIEGFLPEEIKDFDTYELLKDLCDEENFYLGKQLDSQQESLEYLELDKLNNNEVISYGSPNRGNFLILTVSEMIKYFEINGMLTNPFYPKQILDIRTLRKISRFSQPLGAIIKKIQLENLNGTLKLRKFEEFYTDLDINQKRVLISDLDEFLTLGMIMRGWDKNKDAHYPIREPGSLSQDEIELKTLQQIKKVKQLEYYQEIANLPLFTYKCREFIVSNVSTIGLTLRERIEIVLMGEDYPTEDSCIKISSNWIVATIYRIKTFIDYKMPFPIDELVYMLGNPATQ